MTTRTATRGVLYVHSSPSALCPHIEWAVGGVLGEYLGLVPTLLIGAGVGALAVIWVLAGPIRIGWSVAPAS